MMARDPELKKDLDATLQTRKELGPEYESELLDSFLEKVEYRLDEKVAATADRQVRRHLAERQMSVARGGRSPAGAPSGSGPFAERFGFAAVSLVLAIPLSAIGAVNAGLAGLLVTWTGIVGVNVAQAAGGVPWARRSRKGERDAEES
ncbi:hypothetical protein BLA24_16100 [Streptomyces cinnamoneus]|uniref:Integral membrane protein n=1 Tax=Streptomyces cinnamoneus TaxID=53446 RepID=A0A2G1XJ36_STRCJ|nr:hypothetical protein [Streptomyces cinnamoneus]PHQ51268.1 hypothetical protein BLA24_16100 [Streptomyces cinnamoneus]PPT13506.1 hypothetical protein CYQ11_11975 [Streptomyces cinnamoneus]